ncbi:hypothetical protein [Yoonia sp. 2307UL14-13]|uniref:hypothetical protein n=1 Tax=Yoonia sp. 2307UL14-13 TaxID=3126506 RepID=UPI0030A38CA2
MKPTPLFICLILAAQPAWAAFGCDVAGVPGDIITLHESPDAGSPVVARVPTGASVSLFDEPQDTVGQWQRVAYSEDQTAFWGNGVKGWIMADSLGECG